MQTQIEKIREQNKDYNKTLSEESLGKYPSYFVTATSTLSSQTNLKAFYFRVETSDDTIITYKNDRTGQTLTRTLTNSQGLDYWGDFSILGVDSGDGVLLVYVK